MKWESMNQQQKQKVILGVILGIGCLVALKQFVLTPFLNKRAANREEYETLKSKLDKAATAAKNEFVLSEKLEASTKELLNIANELVPSSDNPLSWVTRKLYAQARLVGVDIESVSEADGGLQTFELKEQAQRAFKPYGVRLMTQCTYAQLVNLVRLLEDNNPYLSVSGINISSQLGSANRHQVTILVEWPFWKDPARTMGFKAEEEDE